MKRKSMNRHYLLADLESMKIFNRIRNSDKFYDYKRGTDVLNEILKYYQENVLK